MSQRKRVEMMLQELREMRNRMTKPGDELRKDFNSACDRLDVLVSLLTQLEAK